MFCLIGILLLSVVVKVIQALWAAMVILHFHQSVEITSEGSMEPNCVPAHAVDSIEKVHLSQIANGHGNEISFSVSKNKQWGVWRILLTVCDWAPTCSGGHWVSIEANWVKALSIAVGVEFSITFVFFHIFCVHESIEDWNADREDVDPFFNSFVWFLMWEHLATRDLPLLADTGSVDEIKFKGCLINLERVLPFIKLPFVLFDLVLSWEDMESHDRRVHYEIHQH